MEPDIGARVDREHARSAGRKAPHHGPLAHIDPPHQADWLAIVRRHVARGGTAVSVLHELALALQADDLVLVTDGRVAHHGATHDAATHRALAKQIATGRIAACHDVSDGGAAVAAAEMCIASGLGMIVGEEVFDFEERLGSYLVELTDVHHVHPLRQPEARNVLARTRQCSRLNVGRDHSLDAPAGEHSRQHACAGADIEGNPG